MTSTALPAASFSDLDGLVITMIASKLDIKSAASLAAVNRSCHDVLAAVENEDFWKRVARETWGCRGVDEEGAVPRLPGERGAGDVADSWKECCVEHSDLLSRYGEDGQKAAKAWHRIEAALAVVAPRALAALEAGYQIPPHPEGGEIFSRELLAAAAMHNGQLIMDPKRAAANLEQWASVSLLGSITCYNQGFFLPMRNLVPSFKGTRLARDVACSREQGDELVPCVIVGEEEEGDEDTGEGAGGGGRGGGKVAIVRLHIFACAYFVMEGASVGDLDVSSMSMVGSRREELPIEGASAIGVDVGNGRVFSVSLIDTENSPLLVARPADNGGEGFLYWLEKLAEAIETGQLGARPGGEPCFPLSGPMQTVGVHPETAMRAATEERRGRRKLAPPPRVRGGTGTGGSLSRFPSSSPGLESRVSHGAILLSRSSAHSWLSRTRSPDEANAFDGGFYPVEHIAEIFSYKITMRLLSVEEQREVHAASSSSSEPFRPIRRAMLMARHWETRDSTGELFDTVDGRGVIGYFPTLVARENRDDDDGGDGEDCFSYCSRCEAPSLPPPPPRNNSGRAARGRSPTPGPPPPPVALPGQNLGSFGGYLVFAVDRGGEGVESVRAEVPTLDLVVPEVKF